MDAVDDFSRAPWLYPGTPVAHSDPIGEAALDPEQNGGRVLVVAVGSNASRAVLRRKFQRFGVRPTVSFLRARVTGLRAGHSAHISVPGYIPAAPVADPYARTELVASLLDTDGLAAVDATEPNYCRQELSTERFPLELELAGGRARPAAFAVYRSQQGILGPPGESALQLTDQERLYDRLVADCAGFARLAPGSPRTAMRALAADAELRSAGRQLFRDAGWVQPDGL